MDAAYAGTFGLLPELSQFFEGLELADSFDTNPHKGEAVSLSGRNGEQALHARHCSACRVCVKLAGGFARTLASWHDREPCMQPGSQCLRNTLAVRDIRLGTLVALHYFDRQQSALRWHPEWLTAGSPPAAAAPRCPSLPCRPADQF